MKILKVLQVVALATMVVSLIGMFASKSARAEPREYTQANMAAASAGGPVLIEPKRTVQIGSFVFVNTTDKRCVAKVNAEGLVSIGCGDLGRSKTARGSPKGRLVVTIGKGKDKYGKGDELVLSVAERK